MRLVKYTHACVRLEHDGGVLVIDPGVWSEPEALDGADAVLVTHAHADHLDRDGLAGRDVPVHGPAGVGGHEVAAGETFRAAGFEVRAVGGRHAEIWGGKPDVPNLGYLVAGVYHPGDALHVPDEPVETLLVPLIAPWLKTGEAIDFARAVAPARAYGIHDAQGNERALGSVNAWLEQEAGCAYRYLEPGTSA